MEHKHENSMQMMNKIDCNSYHCTLITSSPMTIIQQMNATKFNKCIVHQVYLQKILNKAALKLVPCNIVCHRVCKPAYLVPVPSQDKLGGMCQEGHPA